MARKKITAYEMLVSDIIDDDAFKNIKITVNRVNFKGKIFRSNIDLKDIVYNPEFLKTLILFVIDSDIFEKSKKIKYSELFINAVYEIIDAMVKNNEESWMEHLPNRMADIICFLDKYNKFNWSDYEHIGYILTFAIGSKDESKDCLLKKIVNKLNEDDEFYRIMTEKVFDYQADIYTIPIMGIAEKLDNLKKMNENINLGNVNLIRNLIYILYTTPGGNSNIEMLFKIKKLSWLDVYEFIGNFFLTGHTEIKSQTVFYKEILDYFFRVHKNNPKLLLKIIEDLPYFETTKSLLMLSKKYKDKTLIMQVLVNLLKKYFDHQIPLESEDRLRIYEFLYENGYDRNKLKKFLSKEIRSGKINEFKKKISEKN